MGELLKGKVLFPGTDCILYHVATSHKYQYWIVEGFSVVIFTGLYSANMISRRRSVVDYGSLLSQVYIFVVFLCHKIF